MARKRWLWSGKQCRADSRTDLSLPAGLRWSDTPTITSPPPMVIAETNNQPGKQPRTHARTHLCRDPGRDVCRSARPVPPARSARVGAGQGTACFPTANGQQASVTSVTVITVAGAVSAANPSLKHAGMGENTHTITLDSEKGHILSGERSWSSRAA